MFRNYLAAALRNMVRNRLYTVINIVGLAVALAAALLIALFVRDELNYDRWIPGHEHVFFLTMTDVNVNGGFENFNGDTAYEFTPQLKLDFPGIQRIARLAVLRATLRRGGQEANEQTFWADPDFFRILPVPAIAGDLATALDRPDGIVLTRALARKYFGRDDPIGETIELGREHTMQVTAVIADLPSNTHLHIDAVASGRAAFSTLTATDARPDNPDGTSIGSRTYIQLAPAVSPGDVQQGLPAFMLRHKKLKQPLVLTLIPITGMHLYGPPGDAVTATGSLSRVYAASTTGFFILIIACINFINLMTARATRRAIEIGVRKVSGAERRDLIFQFLGESLFYALLSLVLAVALASALLPGLNAFLQRVMAFDLWRDPLLACGALLLAFLTGVAAGCYPAFLLSGLRPSQVLKSAALQPTAMAMIRQALVVLQFTILIGLIFATIVTYRQASFAERETLRVSSDQVLLVGGPNRGGNVRAACSGPFKEAVRALPGVLAVQCASGGALDFFGQRLGITAPDGSPFRIAVTPVYDGFFEFYGVAPLAGRTFSPDYGDADKAQSPEGKVLPAILNETAARKYGFASPTAAIGQLVDGFTAPIAIVKPAKFEIVGVVPDFSVLIRQAVEPAIYLSSIPSRTEILSLKLVGREIPETLEAIDAAWARFGDPVPTPRQFLSSYVESLYRDVALQTQLLGICAGVAIFLAVLGLFGLAAFTAERRTKEIGIRKAMGASRSNILGLLLWEFSKPVLWANVIAWPTGYFVMQRWLEGFARHVDLAPWMFFAASALALLIAVLTVVGHTIVVARAQPVAALRYE